MKEEIKQQIDEIRNGTIPRGYKSSVVFIPNEWNVIPLREIVAKVNDLNSGNKITEVFSNSAANGVISQRDYFEKDIANQDNTESYTIVQPDDYIYNPRISNMAPFGPIRKNKLHKTGIVSPLYTVFRQVKKDLVCEDYLELYLSSSQWYKYVYSVANQGARFDRMNITEGDLLNMPIVYPAIKEQRKIVETLSACDETIELYKQKTEQLQILKKYLLEKMFPQDGADTPEIRFPGFTDHWKLHRLGQLYTERNEQGDASLKILSVSIHSGVSDGELDIDELGKVVHRSEDKSTYKHVYTGDLVFNMMRAWQGAIGTTKVEGMISPAYISAIPSSEIYPPFMNYLLRRKKVINQINNLSYGITAFRKRLYWDSFIRIVCKIPSISEQKRITEIFEKFDAMIALHEQMIANQQKYKETLTQLLLKGIVHICTN